MKILSKFWVQVGQLNIFMYSSCKSSCAHALQMTRLDHIDHSVKLFSPTMYAFEETYVSEESQHEPQSYEIRMDVALIPYNLCVRTIHKEQRWLVVVHSLKITTELCLTCTSVFPLALVKVVQF
jgi:hypothetical protein